MISRGTFDVAYVDRRPPEIGSRVKVWFDRRSGDLLVEASDGAVSKSIYNVCLGDAVFGAEQTTRGATRCVVTGTFLAIPGTRESSDIEREIHGIAREHLDFYWTRDKSWPISRARLACIGKPHGGFPTSMAADTTP